MNFLASEIFVVFGELLNFQEGGFTFRLIELERGVLRNVGFYQ